MQRARGTKRSTPRRSLATANVEPDLSVEDLRRALVAALNQHGLTARDLTLLSRGTESSLSGGAFADISIVSEDDLNTASLRVLRAVTVLVDETLGTSYGQMYGHLFRPGWVRILLACRAAVGASLLAVVTYAVVACILDRRSQLVENPAIAFLLLTCLLGALAIFEGLQISVMALRLVDISALTTKYKRVARLHRSFRWEAGTRKFLAGRQFAVIVVVFFVARLTSFGNDRSVPGLPFELPGLAARVLFEFGIAGALFTLWWGQLLPQFLANKRPAWFGNIPPSPLAYYFGSAVDGLGVTAPADWAAAADRSPEEPELVISGARRYRQAVQSIEGAGHLGITKQWSMRSSGEAVAVHTTHTYVAGNSIERLLTQGHYFSEGARPTRITCEQALLRGDGEVPVRTELEVENEISPHFVPLAVATPTVGSFSPGDTLKTRFDVSAPDPGTDTLSIVGPCKFLLFRLTCIDAPLSFHGVRTVIKQVGQTSDEDGAEFGATQARRLWLPATTPHGFGGAAVAEAVFMYPDVGATYEFTWEIEWP